MIPSDIIEEILHRVSIVDLISRRISLKRSGHNYMGLCPFHNDKNNPSLSVSDEKGLYHCFSCGAGGNALTFIKEYDKLDFIDAIKELSKIAGIDIDDYLNNQDNLPLRNRLKTMHHIAQEYFNKQLYNYHDAGARFAVKTIKQRRLDKNTIHLFGLGYGGTGWTGLFDHLRDQAFDTDEIVLSGLCGKTENGKFYDRFRNRITFPVADQEGHIIAFGGRALDSHAHAKYINSPESPLFKKGNTLYGWHLAKEQVIESGQIILVEGYIDVIRLFQAGFTIAAAPLGTGLSEDRIRFLKHKVDQIILCFDGDIAGQKSAYRSAGIAAMVGIPTKVVQLPEDDDPDTFLLQHGAQEFSVKIEHSISGEEFVLNTASHALPDTKKFLQLCFEYAISLEGENNSPSLTILTEQFLKKLSEKALVSFGTIELEFSRFKEQYFRFDKQSISHENMLAPPPVHQKAYEILAILITFPEFIDHIALIVSPDDFPTQKLQEFYKEILFHPERTLNDWLIKVADNNPFLKEIAKLTKAPDIRIIKNYAVGLKIDSLKRTINQLSHQVLQHANEQQNIELSKKIQVFQAELIKYNQEFYNL